MPSVFEQPVNGDGSTGVWYRITTTPVSRTSTVTNIIDIRTTPVTDALPSAIVEAQDPTFVYPALMRIRADNGNVALRLSLSTSIFNSFPDFTSEVEGNVVIAIRTGDRDIAFNLNMDADNPYGALAVVAFLGDADWDGTQDDAIDRFVAYNVDRTDDAIFALADGSNSTFTVATLMFEDEDAPESLAMSAEAGDPTATFDLTAVAPVTPEALALEATAGNPVATFALTAIAPVTPESLAMTATAGEPTANFDLTNHDADPPESLAMTARAGDPTAAFALTAISASNIPQPSLASDIPAGIAIPFVHLGWSILDTLVSGNAIPTLNGLYDIGELDGETTKVTGPAPEFYVTYDDGTDEWIVLEVTGTNYEYRAIADGDSGSFTVGSIQQPDTDMEYALALVSDVLKLTMNGRAIDVAGIGDASGGTLTLYAEPDTAKNQRVRYRSITEDFDWYADVPFLRLDANPRVPLVDSRSSVTSGKDSLRALNPFRVPDGNVQIRITADEFIAEAWQVDFPAAVVEAYEDGSGAVIYRSQLVGRVETPRYEGNPFGVLCSAQTDRQHGESSEQYD